MKKSIAHALRRLANRFDPAGPHVTNVTNINVTNDRAIEDGTGPDIAAAQQRLNEACARISVAGKATSEEFSRRNAEDRLVAAYKQYETAALDYVRVISRAR
jgi:bacillopeptidase F (M6 metalloprotease family)